jgi:hypothetical protein
MKKNKEELLGNVIAPISVTMFGYILITFLSYIGYC